MSEEDRNNPTGAQAPVLSTHERERRILFGEGEPPRAPITKPCPNNCVFVEVKLETFIKYQKVTVVCPICGREYNYNDWLSRRKDRVKADGR